MDVDGVSAGEGSSDGTGPQNSSSGDVSCGLFSPSGLKVLVVDDDPMCLKVVSAMLQRCNYEVETQSSGQEALLLLRERQEQNHQFDLVLSDVYMPDMDGFRLLELIGLELDLPVIMMSSNGDTNVVLRGVTHGAVDFLIKPVRVEELRNVWQHVVRRRTVHTSQGGEESSGLESEHPSHHGVKRKEAEALQVQHETQGANKKPRVVWSVEMHQQFVDAVNQLGVDKAVPKRILDLMNVEGLTRENVASHLQKYRLYLKRAQGLQNSKGSKGHKAAQEAAMLDPQAAAAAAAVAAGAGPSSVFAQVAAQQGMNGGPQQQAAGPAQCMPGMGHAGMVMGLSGAAAASMAAAAAWQQQSMAMQAAAAAAAAASGGMPTAIGPPAGMPFAMPHGAMIPAQLAAAMAAGMPVGMMAARPGMDASMLGGMVYGQHVSMAAAAAQQQHVQQQQQQRQAAAAAAATAAVAAGTEVKQEAPAAVAPGFPAASAAHPSNASVLTADSGMTSNGLGAGSDTSHGAAGEPDALGDLGPVTGGLGDTESLLHALNADSFLNDVPLPQLEMDDFLDSFLTKDSALEEGL